MTELKCTRIIVKSRGEKRLDGSVIRWHQPCNDPANRIVLKGDLTQAEAVLCYPHQLEAEREIEIHHKGKAKKTTDQRQLMIDTAGSDLTIGNPTTDDHEDRG